MNIVCVMNFVRGCEPRYPNKDLLAVLRFENALNKRYGFPNTFLLQYDAFIRPEFADFFKRERDENTELGVWIEIVRPLTEKVGIPWRGRPGFDWDWFVDPGFLPAYTDAEKEALIDELMARFYETFGFYPKTAASWIIDAYSMRYLSEKYAVSALGICREQLCVDAYTLWGGPYNQPYYPCVKNMLCPAQTEENRIKTPVFRLLGIEPVRGYFEERCDPEGKSCVTMEPYWDAAKKEDYMTWFFDTYFENENMGIGFVQIGQENSFGLQKIAAGLETQYALIDKYRGAGKVTLMMMGEAGEYVQKTYADTPPQAVVVDRDALHGRDLASVWFSNKFYRANLFLDHGKLYFRDVHKFDENYPERYRDAPCRQKDAVYDDLPVASARTWAKSASAPDAGVFFDGAYAFKEAKRDGNALVVTCIRTDGGRERRVRVAFSETAISIDCAGDLAWKCGGFSGFSVEGDRLRLVHNGYAYEVLLKGDIRVTSDGFVLSGEKKEIVLH